MNNKGIMGGAISINWSQAYQCYNTIKNSVFINNSATNTGGALSYNSYEPEVMNNIFENNTAIFGNEISSYAAKIMHVKDGVLTEVSELDNIPSGLTIDDSIQFAVVNAEGNIMTNDDSSVIKFEQLADGAKVSGQNAATVDQGKTTFTNTIFTSSPGNKKVEIKITSTVIDYEMLQNIDPVKYADQIIKLNFRWWKPGEIQIGNICIKCNTGSYSLIWNETQCHNCPNYASCEKEIISLNSGYWRISRNSTEIMECPNEDACLGGYNATSTHPVNWKEGYQGLLCNEWETEGDNKYERISDNQWSKCPAFWPNLLRIVGSGIGILLFMVVLIA
jgi:hypothetical protein